LAVKFPLHHFTLCGLTLWRHLHFIQKSVTISILNHPYSWKLRFHHGLLSFKTQIYCILYHYFLFVKLLSSNFLIHQKFSHPRNHSFLSQSSDSEAALSPKKNSSHPHLFLKTPFQIFYKNIIQILGKLAFNNYFYCWLMWDS